MEFTREELWALESRANKASETVLNEDWKVAYRNLAFAASVLDAFIARSTHTPSVESASAEAVTA